MLHTKNDNYVYTILIKPIQMKSKYTIIIKPFLINRPAHSSCHLSYILNQKSTFTKPNMSGHILWGEFPKLPVLKNKAML